MRFKLRHLKNNRLNLCGEYVYTAYDKHIVTTSEDAVHADQCTPTRTFVIVQSRKVFSAIAQQRHSFFGEMRKHQFSCFARCNRLKRFRVYDFREIMVFIEMRTMLALTFVSYTGAGYLAQPIDVISFYSQFRFNVTTHILCPWLCPESAELQFELFTRKTGVLNGIRQIQSIRRRATKNRRTEIMHQRYLLLRITAGHWNYGSTDIFSTGMSTQPAGKEPVSV